MTDTQVLGRVCGAPRRYPREWSLRNVTLLLFMASAVSLSGCTLPPFPTSTPPGALDPSTAPTEATPMAAGGTATPCVAYTEAYPGGKAYPCPLPTVVVRPEIAGLPPGAVPDVQLAWRWQHRLDAVGPDLGDPYAEGAGIRVVDFVPLRLDDGAADLAVVVSDWQSSRAIWRLRSNLAPRLGLAPPLEPVSFRVSNDADRLYVDEASRHWLLLVNWRTDAEPSADDVAVRAAIPMDGSALLKEPEGRQVAFADWTGDGVPDPIVVEGTDAEGRGVATGAEVFLSAGIVARGPVASLAPPETLVDSDGDGVAEVVAPSGVADTWSVRKWDGASFAPASPIVEPPSTPTALRADALPPLPADLFFLRNGNVWRWPRSGGAAEQVTSEPAPGKILAQDPTAGGVYWFELSADGRHMLYPVEREEQNARGEISVRTELVVLDLDDGMSRSVTNDHQRGVVSGPYHALSPDGSWVVYLGDSQRVSPDGVSLSKGRMSRPPGLARALTRPPAGGGDEGTFYLVDVGDPASQRDLADCSSQEGEYGATIGCDGLLVSLDGRRMAFADGVGLWVIDLPSGSPRSLGRHHTEPTGGNYSVDSREAIGRPVLWSTDGRWFVTEVRFFEGSGKAVWNVDAGTHQTVEDTFEYVGPGRSDLAWLAGKPAIIHARVASGSSPLTLVDPADTTHVTPVLQLVLLGSDPSVGYWAISPHVLPNGAIGFGLRQTRTDLFRGNGIFRIQPDGHNWAPIVTLPPLTADDQDYPEAEGVPDVIHWSPGGAAFLLDAPVAGTHWTGDVPDQALRLVGLASGSGLWDAGAVLAGARAFTWGPEE